VKQPVEGVVSPFARLLQEYISTSIWLCASGLREALVEQNLILNTLKEVPEYATLSVFTLMWEASKTRTQILKVGEMNTESNTALFLAKELMRWKLEVDGTLQILAELSYLLHSVSLSAPRSEAHEATRVIEAYSSLIDSPPEHFTASLSLLSTEETEAKRKFLYLTLLSLTQWAGKDLVR
jgi:hypothetical protein